MERAIEEEKQKLDELVKEKEVQKQVMENVKKLMLEDEEKEMNLIRAVKEVYLFLDLIVLLQYVSTNLIILL